MKKIYIIACVVILAVIGFIILSKKMKTEKPTYVEFVTIEKEHFIHSILVNGKITSKKIETVKASGNGIITDSGFLNKAFLKKGDVIARVKLLETEHLKKQQEYDLNKIDLDLAVKQHELQIELFEAKAISERDLKQSEVQLLKQQIQMDNLEKEIKPKALQATFNGMLVNKKFNDQDVITNGKELYTLIDINELCVELPVFQDDVTKCRVGQKVMYESESMDSTFFGEITEISTMAIATDNQGRQNNAVPIFNVYCSINLEPNKNVLFGSRLEARIVLSELDSLICVPLEAILYREVEKVVMVKRGSVAIEISVSTGRYNDEMIEIVSGLEIGDEVITKGNLMLRDGGEVTTEKVTRARGLGMGIF